MSAATPVEWAQAAFLGLPAIGAIGFALAFADADLAYFDPRPPTRRALTCCHRCRQVVADRVRLVVWDVTRSDALYPLLREWDNARHTTRELWRDAVALLILLATSPKEANR